MTKKIKIVSLFNEPDPFLEIPTRKSVGVLALDVATHCGFCTGTASGVWDLSPKRDESKGMRLIRFKAKLKLVYDTEAIKIIVFEQTSGHHKNALITQSELHGVLKLFCEENKIEYKSYASTAIKKDATGNGNAAKPLMIAAAKKYNPSVESDDEADAIHLYNLAIKDLSL